MGKFQWITGARADGTITDEVALQLICVQRFHVSSVILVEIRKAVVEQHWRSDVIGNFELNCTSIRWQFDSTVWWSMQTMRADPSRFRRARVLERRRPFVCGDLDRDGWSATLAEAVCVVYLKLLNLRRVSHNPPHRSKADVPRSWPIEAALQEVQILCQSRRRWEGRFWV